MEFESIDEQRLSQVEEKQNLVFQEVCMRINFLPSKHLKRICEIINDNILGIKIKYTEPKK